MITRDEQLKRVLRYLQTPYPATRTPCAPDVPEDLLRRARAAVAEAPDLCEERVAAGKRRLAAGPPSAEEVADRIMRDALCGMVH